MTFTGRSGAESGRGGGGGGAEADWAGEGWELLLLIKERAAGSSGSSRFPITITCSLSQSHRIGIRIDWIFLRALKKVKKISNILKNSYPHQPRYHGLFSHRCQEVV